MVKGSHSLNESESPLVSVCIPAYNSEATLGETLESVLAQDYPHIEVVVSDNQSTDQTKVVVQKYAPLGVRYCTPGKRPEWATNFPGYIGAYINANFVLAQGRGEYLCLFHSDDLYEPSIIRKQIEVMQANPNVGAVFTRMRTIGEDGRPIRMGTSTLPDELRGRSTLDFTTLLNAVMVHSNFLPTPSVMLRRSVIEKMGGFDERRFLTSADLEMWLRIAYQGYELAIIDVPLLNYRISQRQFGDQYNKLRTTLADIFGVLDHYLSLPGVRDMIQPASLDLYELARANDQILCCGRNLLTQGRVVEARARMRESLHWQDFMRALRRPLMLVRLTLGAGYLASTYLGLGHWVGKQAYRISLRMNRLRREPLR